MSQQDDTFDPWTTEALTRAHNNLPAPHLTFDSIECVVPLDDQFGIHPPKTVPDVLYELFFGQPEPTKAEIAHYGGHDKVPPMQTYAILDAAKVVNLAVTLETTGLEHSCLFKGNAYDELKDVAPWIVCLEEHNKFTRHLFSKGKAPWYMWDKKPGIYVRSRWSLDNIWRHFRKFTRVQDEQGKWFYFRFWEAQSFADYMRIFQQKNLGEIPSIFGSDTLEIPMISAAVCPLNFEVVNIKIADTDYIQFAKEKVDMAILRRVSLITYARQFARNYLGDTVPKEAEDAAISTVLKYSDLGFKSRYHLGSFVYWVLALGMDFERQNNIIWSALHATNTSPEERFITVSKEMKKQFGDKIRNYRGKRN